MKAQHRLSANGTEQMADLFMDSHPVRLLVALITAEDKMISAVHTLDLIILLTPSVHVLHTIDWIFLEMNVYVYVYMNFKKNRQRTNKLIIMCRKLFSVCIL